MSVSASVSPSSVTATATVVTATPSTAPTNVESSAAGYNRSACTECQRRKQKVR